MWDCPDLTTKDAAHYQARVIEIAAFAELGVYVASDERYNDELPTNFLQAMLEAGKWIVVVLTKSSPMDADELIRLFDQQVAQRLKHRERILSVLAIPAPLPGKLNELWTEAFPYGSRLRDAIEQATGDFAAAKEQVRLRCGDVFPRQSKPVARPGSARLGGVAGMDRVGSPGGQRNGPQVRTARFWPPSSTKRSPKPTNG